MTIFHNDQEQLEDVWMKMANFIEGAEEGLLKCWILLVMCCLDRKNHRMETTHQHDMML